MWWNINIIIFPLLIFVIICYSRSISELVLVPKQRPRALYQLVPPYLAPDQNTVLYFTWHIRPSKLPASECNSRVVSPVKQPLCLSVVQSNPKFICRCCWQWQWLINICPWILSVAIFKDHTCEELSLHSHKIWHCVILLTSNTKCFQLVWKLNWIHNLSASFTYKEAVRPRSNCAELLWTTLGDHCEKRPAKEISIGSV